MPLGSIVETTFYSLISRIDKIFPAIRTCFGHSIIISRRPPPILAKEKMGINQIEDYQEPEDIEFFNQIENDYKNFGLTQGPNEFLIKNGKRTIHIAKRYEVLIERDTAKKWVNLRDFIELVLIQEGLKKGSSFQQ